MRGSQLRLTLFALLLAAAVVLGLTACGSGSSTSSSSSGGSTESSGETEPVGETGSSEGGSTETGADVKAGEIKALCPEEPVKVAYVKANGGEVWTATTMAEFEEESKKCPNIETITSNVTGGQQAAVSAYNAAVAQGAKIILTIGDFGPALLPAIQSAYKSGVVVVPFLAEVGGEEGVDYTTQMLVNSEYVGEAAAKWFNENVKTGKVVALQGPPGISSSTTFFEHFKKNLDKYAPGMELVPDNSYTPTGFTAEGMKQAMSSLLAKYGKIAGAFTDYGAAYTGAIQAVEEAGAEQPALVDVASSNGMLCEAEKAKVKLLSLDGTTQMVRAALRIALAEYAEMESPEENPFTPEQFVNTAKEPGEYKCDPSISPDADLSSLLPKSQIKELISEQ